MYVALLHHPVYDKNGQIVTTAVTNMDIHDIARSGCTYGLAGFFVVTPVKALQKLALKIVEHWESGYGSQYNATRKEALALARICDSLDDAIIAIERETGEKPDRCRDFGAARRKSRLFHCAPRHATQRNSALSPPFRHRMGPNRNYTFTIRLRS